ncbi:hypothetical protein BGZ76_006750, partial [Entomortierella beljakovae]
MTSANANAPESVASHEVGMMFVHEYYTFLNKEPSRLHCFYNKQSTMSHGIQGEEIHVCHGQQDIHSKILGLGFEDCKVLVSNVDSQSSLNGGIMIQVLGEMSNKGGPSQKFVQTFFLAEQPKGYYVLNDIFRYLKDDHDTELEGESDEPEVEEVATVVVEDAVVIEEVVPVVTPPVAEVVPVEEVKVEAQEEKKPAVVEEKKSVEKKADNKKHDKKSEKKDSKKDETKEAKKDIKKEEAAEKPKANESSKKQQNATTVAAAAAAPVAAVPAESTQEETTTNIPDAAPVVAPAPAAAPEPSKPKTWANLAANNPSQWGSHANAAAKGTTINVAQPAAKSQTPQPTQSQNKPQSQRPSGRDEVHGIYVKNVTEKMTIDQLREVFSKFGSVKHVELTNKKNCAYVDFDSNDAVQAALKQNKVNVGSEVVLAEERRRPGFQNGGGRS